jgi:hypothetical protein
MEKVQIMRRGNPKELMTDEYEGEQNQWWHYDFRVSTQENRRYNFRNMEFEHRICANRENNWSYVF